MEKINTQNQELFDASFQGITIHENGKILEANQALADMLGYSVSELVGMDLFKLAVLKYRSMIQDYIRIQSESLFELEFVRKDDTTVIAEMKGITFSFQGSEIRIDVVRDITERKRAEEVLWESEKRYRELADLLPQTVFEIDLEGNFTFANSYGFKSSGYTREDLDKGLNALQLFIPEDRDRVKENIQRILSGEKLGGNEYTAQRKDGSTFPVIIYSSPIIREGKPVGLRGMVIDISERKRTEEALLESEKRYRMLYEENPSMYFTVDTEGTVLSVNKFGAEQLGYTVEELVGKSVLAVFNKDDKKAFLQQLTSLLQNPTQVAHWEFRKVRKNGSMLWVKETARAVKDTNGNIIILIVCKDITELKQVHEELLCITKAVECSSDSIGITDAQCKIIYHNPAMINLLGYTAEEANAAGGPPVVFADSNVANDLFDTIMRGDSWNETVELIPKGGHTKTVSLHADAVKDDNNNIIGLIGIHTDISDRIKAQKEKERFSKKLADAEKMAVLGQFTTSIAHELNNPLDIIQTKLFLLERNLSEDTDMNEMSQHITKIKQQVLRISHLTKDILHYAKPSSKSFVPTNINEILMATVDQIKESIPQFAKLKTKLYQDISIILGNPIGLGIVFKNIIFNAVESLTQKGEILISTRNVNSKYVEIIIQDTGQGISPDDLPKLFNPFFTRKKKSGGTGLGLPICEKILNEHQGTITVESTLNKGTCVFVRLPINK